MDETKINRSEAGKALRLEGYQLVKQEVPDETVFGGRFDDDIEVQVTVNGAALLLSAPVDYEATRNGRVVGQGGFARLGAFIEHHGGPKFSWSAYLREMKRRNDHYWTRLQIKGETEAGDALKAIGFEVVGTGGGCTGFERKLANGGHVLVTVEDDACVPENLDDKVCLGVYLGEDEGDMTNSSTGMTVRQLVERFQKEGEFWT